MRGEYERPLETYLLSPAVSAKGTVKPSANPIIASLTYAALWVCSSVCGRESNVASLLLEPFVFGSMEAVVADCVLRIGVGAEPRESDAFSMLGDGLTRWQVDRS